MKYLLSNQYVPGMGIVIASRDRVRITPLNRFHVDIEFKFLSDNDGIFILSLKIAHDHTEANVRSLWRSDVYKFTLDQMHCSVCYTKIDLSPPPTRYSEN
uniref:Uncharacterized protein n=1 Tax=Globodera pallida TaxID=36090 RepID=A0A183BZE1_GLOPA